jgi:TPP-dependent 2-oxoacid decarboxylase
MNEDKDLHLRVRITESHRRILDDVIRQRAKNETLSDVVRLIIEQAAEKKPEYVLLPLPVFETAKALAQETERSVESVVAESVKGIVSLLAGNERPPLIIEEVKLRRSYQEPASEGRSHSPRTTRSAARQAA